MIKFERTSKIKTQESKTYRAGIWWLDRDQMTWRRNIDKTNTNGNAPRAIDAIMVRDRELITVNDLTSNLAVIHSAPDASEELGDLEGLWLETSTNDPISEIDSRIYSFGVHAVRSLFDSSVTETTELIPRMVGPVTRNNSDRFLTDPLVLTGVTVYVKSHTI